MKKIWAMGVSTKIAVHCGILLFTLMTHAAAEGESSWVDARLNLLRRSLGQRARYDENGEVGTLSPDDTLALLQEAEQWRWGRRGHNRTADPHRAVELYWTAASGSGPAAASALFQLGWLYVMPPRLAPAQAIWEPGISPGGPKSSAILRYFGDGKRPLLATGTWEAIAVGAGDTAESTKDGAKEYRAQRKHNQRDVSLGWVGEAARRYLRIDVRKFWLLSYLKQWGKTSERDNIGLENFDTETDAGDLFTLASSAARKHATASGAHLQFKQSKSAVGYNERGSGTGAQSLVGASAAISIATGDPTGRNVSAALELWSHAASLGNPDAQQILATHFANAGFLGITAANPTEVVSPGSVVSTANSNNDIVSIVYAYFAALGGSLGAQMNMGYRYLYGYGVSQDCEAALPYYELAANQAVEAIRAAASRYPGQVVLPPSEALKTRLSELTVPRNARRAGKETNAEVVAFYEAAAMAGDSSAAASLGTLFLNGGRGVPQDVRLAAKLYHRAVYPEDTSNGMDAVNDEYDGDSHGDDEEISRDEKVVENGNGDTTLAAIRAAEKREKSRSGKSSPNSDVHQKKQSGARETGDASAAGILGVLTYAGIGGLVADEAEAAALWRRGETVGDAIALCGLGVLYLTGSKVAHPPIKRDIKKAVQYFERSGKKGQCPVLFYSLGLSYAFISHGNFCLVLKNRTYGRFLPAGDASSKVGK